MNSRHNRVEFLQQLQTPLSQKPNIFLEIFLAFPKSTENFAHLEKKNSLHSSNVLEVILSEECGSLMPETFRFITLFSNLHLDGFQTLANSASTYFYPNFSLIQDKSELETVSLSHIRDLKTVW